MSRRHYVFYATEAKRRVLGVRRTLQAESRRIFRAALRVTVNVAAAAQHFLQRIAWSGWVHLGAAGVVVIIVPIIDPFPGISGHVKNTVAACSGRIGSNVLKFFLAPIGGNTVIDACSIAPGIQKVLGTARRVFPFGLSG